MGRMVIQSISDMTIASDATQDLWSVIAVSPNRVVLHGFELTSDALVSELMSLTLRRITAAGTGGAASTTEELLDDGTSTALTATFRTEDTTPGTGGGDLMGFQWEQIGAVGHIFTPETRPVAGLTDGFALTCNTAVVATLSGFVIWEEV